MKKIKRKLIKWLGGVTQEEHRNFLRFSHIDGKHFAYGLINEEMRLCYGMPAEKWCEHMYNYVVKLCEESGERYYRLMEIVEKSKS